MTAEAENKQKLETFFAKEYHLLSAYVDSKIRPSGDRDAEDIIQDVALNLFSGADRYSPITNVAGFVYRSIRNRIIDVMRKERNIAQEEYEDEARLMEFAELFYGPSDNAYSEQMIELLKRTIAGMKPPFRDVITAMDLEGYSYREISEETGIPEGTLMSRRHRALAQLHGLLEKERETHN